MKKGTDKRNILLVHNYYKIPGGEDTVVANEKQLLEAHGCQVFLYKRENAELEQFSGRKKMLLPVITIFNPKTYQEIKKIIRKEQIDIVHVHNTLNLISPSVYYAAVSCGVPVVQTVHNFRMLCPAATFYREDHICEECLDQGLGCAVKYRCYRNSRLQTLACVVTTKIHRILGIYRKIHYICLAEFQKDKLLQLNIPGKREMIDPQHVYVKPNFTFRLEQKLYQEQGSEYLFAGRVEKIKGLELLLDAFERLPEEHLLVAGVGTQLEYYQRLAAERGLKNIEFLGFVEKDRLMELMGKAKALIVPSQWYETFGMTVAEAFSVGTPVIAADIGNLSSLVQEGVNGWKFRYDSADELVGKILECNHTPREKLHVICEKSIFPEENYKILDHIYECVMKNNS